MGNSNDSSKTERRINYVDFLKFIGLTGIIIAHVGSPSWAMMMRSFDVPFMVVLSSILANRSYSKYIDSNIPVVKYYISRVNRLVIPTWIFLALFFLFRLVATGQGESVTYYVASFGLTRYGIGYVWIILIYLYSAMLVPLFAKLKQSKKVMILVLLSYIVYEIAYFYKIGLNGGIVETFIDTTFFNIIPYGVLTYLGYNYNKMSKKTKLTIVLISLFVFASLAVYYWIATGTFQQVQIAKYPPRTYYMSYGVACSFALLMICEKKNYKVFDSKIMRYISMHSMWIYLWHVFMLSVYSKFNFPEVWFVKLIIVYVSSVLIVFMVNKLMDRIERKHHLSFAKYLRG